MKDFLQVCVKVRET